MLLSEPERLCITDPRRPRSPRVLLLRIEMWLCRWWSEARFAGRNGEAAELWGAALIVSDAASAVGPPIAVIPGYSFPGPAVRR